MGWIELLRLFAEDQNRATAEANREAIQKLAKAVLFNNTGGCILVLFFAALSIALILTYKSQSKKIKYLENSIKSLDKDVR